MANTTQSFTAADIRCQIEIEESIREQCNVTKYWEYRCYTTSTERIRCLRAILEDIEK